MKIGQKDNQKIVIWGAGFWGSIVLEWIRVWGKGTEFIGFIDTKKYGTYLDYPIIQKEAVEECGTIFVAMEDTKAIRDVVSYLEIQGKVRNQDFFLSCNSPVMKI